ncbi:hypothetical protein FANTH_12650 [Fusarium anthophilum]|uniref:Uncharacterized protein n=1 Tax=Fusarium anthophilum TaxID=48485 RepID=A0A8H4YS40_9HYPO|nr:hypothetical protein FANTH_12650 [Fusarium anthophilum]
MRTNFDPVHEHTKDQSMSACKRITTVFFRTYNFAPLKSVSQHRLKDITVCTGCYDSFDDLWSCTQASTPAVHLYLAKFGASYTYSSGSFLDPNTSCSSTLLDQGPWIPVENEYIGNYVLASVRGVSCCSEAQLLDDGHHSAPQDPHHLGTRRDETS